MTSALRESRLTSLVTDAMSPWRSVEVRQACGSTNAELLADPRPWHVLTTDHQQRGRGRLTRSWDTPAGMAVALSACVPAPSARAADWGWLPLLTGLAVRDALRSLATTVGRADLAEAFVLKWPNDVLVTLDGDRKICGVLCELAAAQELVVLGLGINVHQSREDLPVPTATSLDLCGVHVSREDVVVEVVRALGRRHSQWATPSRMAGVVADYEAGCATIGRQVAIQLPSGEECSGEAVRVDRAGRLVIRTGEGEVAHAAGDVLHARLRA